MSYIDEPIIEPIAPKIIAVTPEITKAILDIF